jgi:NADPH oxidase
VLTSVETLEIQFRKPSMVYKPGQWLFLNCPAVSRQQWHPFTITSCPFDPYVSVHVRQLGDFTRDLADALGAGPAQAELYDDLEPDGIYEIALEAGQSMPGLRIDGPYGAPAEDVFSNEIAVLIGTGIGVTPFASVLKHIWHLRSIVGVGGQAIRKLKRVEFIWICRDTNNFAWFQQLLNSLESQSLETAEYEGEDFLRIHTYLTKKLDLDTVQNIALNSVGADRDPLTELRTRTNFGRPNFKRLFGGLREGIEDGTYMPNLDRYYPTTSENGEKKSKKGSSTNVGVYFCGPGPAAREIKAACDLSTSKDVHFKFWKEHF